ncbi:MAG: integrin alpha [Fuerstiella sp.]
MHVLLLNADGSAKSSIRIASGLNGGPTLVSGDSFGSSVASVGDLDGDGVADLVVGASGTDGYLQGAVYLLLLNADGSAKSSTKIASDTGGGPTLGIGDVFGSSVTSLGDLNGDGVVDLAVGAPGDDAVYVLFLNRPPGFTLSQVTATVSEDGTTTTDSFTVVLDAKPATDVVLDLLLSVNPDAAVDMTSVTFTSSDWSHPQTVNVTGLNDVVDDGDEQTTITVSVNDAASDDAYDTLADQVVTVTTTDDDGTPLPGNVDGDGDFDANDSFLVQLVLLSGTDAQINQSKGISTLTAAEIRAKINNLGSAADVDGDGDTDANDAFLIHLVKLSATDNQIDQSKGTSQLTAAQIRTNVNNLGGGATTQTVVAGSQVLRSVLADEPHSDLFPTGDDDLLLSQVSSQETAFESVTESIWEDFRDWIDAI